MYNTSSFPGHFRTVKYGNLTIEVGTDTGDLRLWSRVIKVCSRPNDYHKDGARGMVVGAFNLPEPKPTIDGRRIKTVYWVEFENMPGMPIEVLDFRIQKIIRSVKITFRPQLGKGLFRTRKIRRPKKNAPNNQNRMPGM
jgi:hypothetical protein